MTTRLRIALDNGVTTIMLDRPDVLNAIDEPMHWELEAAFDAYAADPAQRLCVVTGAGDRAFCAGTDLKEAHDRAMAPTAYPPHGYAGLVERHDLDKPVIAAVNGLALGGGFELALACDIILADRDARFGLPEPTVGAVALGGGIHRLARQIGRKQAMGLLLGAKPVTADEGFRMGFVTAVAEPGRLHALLDDWTARIMAGAPLALQATKQAFRRGLGEPSFAAAMKAQAGYPAWQAWAESDEAREGVAAFVEKRPPGWRDAGPTPTDQN